MDFYVLTKYIAFRPLEARIKAVCASNITYWLPLAP